MIYTVIYEEQATGDMASFTFVSGRHDKDYAWVEFEKKYAQEGQKPVMIMPGNHLVYIATDISFTNVA